MIKQKVYKAPGFSSFFMKATELLEKMKGMQKPVFTINDLQKITGFKKEYLKVYLFRLKQRHGIQELEKGKYTLEKDPFIIASNLIFPSYISFLSAYFYYHWTTQIPKKVQVISSRSKKEVELNECKVQFIKISPARIFGYRKEKFREKYLFVAEKEKAIIDALYLPEYCPLDETYTALKSSPNVDKLIEYGVRMDSLVLLKRLGYLLDLQGADIYPKIKPLLNDRYDSLDPSQKKMGKKSTKWRLVLNTSFQNAA